MFTAFGNKTISLTLFSFYTFFFPKLSFTALCTQLMLFSTLADACLDEALVPAVTDLLRLKMETPEIGLGPRIDIINDYLDASIEEVDQLIQAIPGDEKVTWDELNRLFLATAGLGR